jgi:hypothetical protein
LSTANHAFRDSLLHFYLQLALQGHIFVQGGSDNRKEKEGFSGRNVSAFTWGEITTKGQ